MEPRRRPAPASSLLRASVDSPSGPALGGACLVRPTRQKPSRRPRVGSESHAPARRSVVLPSAEPAPLAGGQGMAKRRPSTRLLARTLEPETVPGAAPSGARAAGGDAGSARPPLVGLSGAQRRPPSCSGSLLRRPDRLRRGEYAQAQNAALSCSTTAAGRAAPRPTLVCLFGLLGAQCDSQLPFALRSDFRSGRCPAARLALGWPISCAPLDAARERWARVRPRGAADPRAGKAAAGRELAPRRGSRPGRACSIAWSPLPGPSRPKCPDSPRDPLIMRGDRCPGRAEPRRPRARQSLLRRRARGQGLGAIEDQQTRRPGRR